MCEFFYGRRQKTGCVTLVMALAFMGGWARSYLVEDVLFYQLNGDRVRCHSVAGGLVFSMQASSGSERSWPRWYRHTLRINSGDLAEYDWRFDDCLVDEDVGKISGFGFAAVYQNPVDKLTNIVLIAPYGSIVIPLTLLSAYLLLSKPRKPKTPAESL